MNFLIPSYLPFLCPVEPICKEADCKENHYGNGPIRTHVITDKLALQKLSVYYPTASLSKAYPFRSAVFHFIYPIKKNNEYKIAMYTLYIDHLKLEEICKLFQQVFLTNTPLIPPLIQIVLEYSGEDVSTEALRRTPNWMSKLKRMSEDAISEDELVNLKRNLKMVE